MIKVWLIITILNLIFFSLTIMRETILLRKDNSMSKVKNTTPIIDKIFNNARIIIICAFPIIHIFMLMVWIYFVLVDDKKYQNAILAKVKND